MAKGRWDAWAIDTRSPEGHEFIGKFWWINGTAPMIPDTLTGSKVALFETRDEARRAVESCKRAFPKAVVRKVSIAVEVLDG